MFSGRVARRCGECRSCCCFPLLLFALVGALIRFDQLVPVGRGDLPEPYGLLDLGCRLFAGALVWRALDSGEEVRGELLGHLRRPALRRGDRARSACLAAALLL
jgi:hypothetical protein